MASESFTPAHALGRLAGSLVRALSVCALALTVGCGSGTETGSGRDHDTISSPLAGGAPASTADVHERTGKDAQRTAPKKLNRVRNGVSGRYIVVLDAPALGISSASRGQRPQAVLTKLASKHVFKHKHVYERGISGFSAEMDEAEAAALARDPDVAYVVEDATARHAAVQTNAPWHLDRVDQRSQPSDGTFTTSGSGRGVNAYVVDTGILANHNEFAGRATIAADYVEDGQKGVDCNGHGTHVSGILAGKTFGVAKEARVHALRVLDCNGSGFISDIMAALEWVAVNHVKPAVVNMSLGGLAFPEFDAVVREVIAAGVPVVVAAGNDSYFAEEFSPARVSEAITVGATNALDIRTDFSNFGSVVDVFAPGEGVPSAWIATTAASVALNGTSMASPIVAGTVALYLEANPTATPAAVEAAIVASSTRGKVKDPGAGSPNRLVFSGLTAPALRSALFVVGQTTLTPDDSALNARLTSLGYAVTVKHAANLVSADATGKNVALVSSTVDSGTVGTKLTNVATPVVSLEGFIFDDLKMTSATGFGQVTTPTLLEIRDDQNALSAGLRGTNQGGVWDHLVQPSTAGGRYWGMPTTSAVGLDGRPVTLQGQPDRAAIFGYEAGAQMVGLAAPARRVGFFADQEAVRSFTAEGWALFDAAIEWASGPVTDAPMARALQASPSPNSVQLRWIGNDLANVQHDILRATRRGGPYTKIATSTAPGTDPLNGLALYAYTDNTAVNGQTYYYVVSPTVGGRAGRSTGEAEAFLGLPGAPWVVIFYIIDINGSLLATEVNAFAPNATHLRIRRADSAQGPFSEIAVVPNGSPGIGTLYDDPTTLPNRAYYYTVQGLNGFGDGATSAPTLAQLDDISPQATPVQNLQARSIAGGVRLNWDHVPNASDYNLVVTRLSDGQFVFVGDVTQPDATLWLASGSDYNVQVQPGGSFAPSSPPVAVNVTASPGIGSALLVVGQTPLRPGDQRLMSELETLGFSVTSKRSADLLSSDASGKDLVVVSSTAIPAQVGTKLTTAAVPLLVMEPYVLGQMQMTGSTAGTNFGVYGNQQSLVIESEHELGGGGIRSTIVSSKLGDFGWGLPTASAIGVGRLPGAVPATGAQPRSLFAYEKGATLANGSAAAARRVALLIDADTLPGLTDDGRPVLQSAVRWAIDPNGRDPREPTGVIATPSGSTISLSWNAVPGAASYVVYRANMAFTPPPGSRARIADIIATGISGSSFTDPAPLAGFAYSYYVAAVGAEGGSDRSSPVFSGLNAMPERPRISTAALNNAVRIDMQAGALTQSLRVLRATQSGGPYTIIAQNLPPTTTTFTATGLSNGVPAYFTVEALNTSNLSRSLEAYGIPHPALAAPTGLSAAASSGQVSLSWAAVSNARAYRVGRGAAASSTATEIVAAESTLTGLTDVNVPNGASYKYFVTPLGDKELAGTTVTITASPRGKVLFVRAATPTAGDNVLRDRLIAVGFDVTEKADTQLVTADATGKDLVVVSETVTSGNIGTKLTNVTVPVLSLEPSILDDLLMTGLSLGNDFGTVANQTQVNIIDPSLPLAAGLAAGNRTANTTAGNYLFGIPGSEAVAAARIVSSATRAAVFGYQPGTTMVGLVAPGRRAGLFVDSNAAGSFTADGRALFDAAVRWTAGLR
jgi:subtilisin family serine protease